MSISNYMSVDKYAIHAICTAPLRIGSAFGGTEEVLIHPIDEKPFIQSSSIAGILRSVSLAVNGKEETEKLFGSKESGSIKISDGTFLDEVTMELRPRVKIDPETGSVSSSVKGGSNNLSGQKFDMESVGIGAEFVFSLYLFDDSLKGELEKILAEIAGGNVQFGGQKTNGHGYIELKAVRYRRFSMEEYDDRKLWAKEDSMSDNDYENITENLQGAEKITSAYELILEGKTDGQLLVKAIAVSEFGKDAPDAANIQNAKKDYIVPGSSLKGVIRNRMTYIAKVLNKDGIIDSIFGKTGETGNTGKAGNLYVKDVIIGSKYDNDQQDLQHRIHIDKFTAGVMHGGLFSEKNTAGDMEMHIRIGKNRSADAAAGLLLLALRDIAAGLVNIGSGYNVGKGFIDVSKISIKSGSKEASIVYFKGSGSEASADIADETGLINSTLAALKNWKKGEEAS